MAVLLLAACTENGVDDLTGEYPIPTDITLNKVTSTSEVKTSDGAKKLFNVTLTGDDNSTFTAQFCCADTWYLEGRTYTNGTAASPAIGSFVVENTKFSSASSNASVTTGTITVSKDDSLNYSIYGVLIMSDKSVVRVHYKGKINYVEPEPTAFAQVLSAKATAGNGFTSIEIILGSDGLQMVQWNGNSFVTGTGSYADIILNSASSTLAPGTYTPVASGSEAPGTFTEGYQGSYGQWTWDAGSRFTVLNNGASSPSTYLTTGSIKVSLDGDIYTITIDCGSVYYRYKGKLTIQ